MIKTRGKRYESAVPSIFAYKIVVLLVKLINLKMKSECLARSTTFTHNGTTLKVLYTINKMFGLENNFTYNGTTLKVLYTVNKIFGLKLNFTRNFLNPFLFR